MSGALDPDEVRRAHDDLQVLLEAVLSEEWTPAGQAILHDELSAALERLWVAEEELRRQADQLAASAMIIDRERERYAELFDFAPDAYVETDEMGKVVEGNQTVSELFDVPVRQMVGKLLVSYVHPDERRAFRRLLADVVDGVGSGEHILRMQSRSGRQVVIGARAARHVANEGESTQVRWLLRDVTDRVKLEVQVEELVDEVEVLTRLAELQQVVEVDDPLAAPLQRIVDLAQTILPTGEIGVSLAGRSDMERVLSTGPRARELDDRQRRAGEGPCIEALRSTAVVRGRPESWPVLADVQDVVEIIGVPMATDGGVDGALNVYVMGDRLDDHTLHLLLLLAEQGSVALENARLLATSAALVGGLQRAMETRGVIERAKGILMAREGCDADQAFDILRRASQRENVKLHDVAMRLVESATAPQPSA